MTAVTDSYKTVADQGQDEFTEKRSKFIGCCKPVTTEEEAISFINQIKSAHWDAKHNVYAYSLRDSRIKRYSDDGEPQGTAGVPALDVLEKSGVTDVVTVVTRYFGGVLLGTGGLVRAYSHSVSIALQAAGIITMQLCSVCSVCCSYNHYGKLSALIPQYSGVIDSSDFTDNVVIKFHIPKSDFITFEKTVTDSTNGIVKVKIESEKFFADAK